MSILFLPEEVLERVFSFFDGRTFARGTQVCTRWRETIYNMLRITNWWKEFCLREIPTLILEELCGNITINLNDDVIQIVHWKSVYKRWYLCNMVSLNCNRVNKFSSFDSTPVTCCKLSGSWILTGHRNGSICAWSSENGDLIRIVTQHLKMVTDFALFDLLKTGPYLCSFHEDLCEHQVSVSISKDHNIQISSLLDDTYGIYYDSHVLRKHSDTLESIKMFDDKFAVLSSNNTASVWLLMLEEHLENVHFSQLQVKAILLYFLHGPNEIMQGISFWNNKLCCLCRNGVFKELDITLEDWSEGTPPKLTIPMDQAIPEDYTWMMVNANLFWKQALFIITSDHRLWVSTSGIEYILYPITQNFDSYVICMQLYGPLLALGLENGFLLVFYVQQPADLGDMHRLKLIWKKRLSPASVIALDISLQESGPVILATTTTTMIVVRWETCHHK